MQKPPKKTILVAPLNWGLGHATRCIPIINALLKEGFDVLIGSDGAALKLLKLEFPNLSHIELPAYNISYPKKGNHFKRNLLLKLPLIYRAAKKEYKTIAKLVKQKRIQGIISDNRLGVRNKAIKSVYLTHQLTVLSGSTTRLSSKIHQHFIKKFDTCWVPDYNTKSNLSGVLGAKINFKKPIVHIGPLSRMKCQKEKKEHDILVILSGPEPQRGLLEKLLLEKLKNVKHKVFIVRGVIEKEQKTSLNGPFTLVNFLSSEALEKAINGSELVICRSGYTSIMDLYALNKKAFLIPTPGQYEQEYLAKKLNDAKRIPSCTQDEFELSKLELIKQFSGWEVQNKKPFDIGILFSIF